MAVELAGLVSVKMGYNLNWDKLSKPKLQLELAGKKKK